MAFCGRAYSTSSFLSPECDLIFCGGRHTSEIVANSSRLAAVPVLSPRGGISGNLPEVRGTIQCRITETMPCQHKVGPLHIPKQDSACHC